MTALLTEHLPLLAGSPKGIKKLRELILELAVRGKLVPQDPNDEPASELLKRIAEEKARLVAEGKIRRQKELADTPKPIVSFPLPRGWVATSIGEATICRDGERVPVSLAERESREKIFDYYGASGVIDKVDGYLFDKPLLLVGEDGANLVNRNTPIAFMARGHYWVNNHAHVLDGITEELLLYIELYFNAIDLKPYVTGTAQPKMNQSKMNGIPVALPPLAEQRRIVAKVDELMALCDRLETRQADAESARAQLVQVLLSSLTQTRDAEDFAQSWQRLAEHFHTLFTTESSIDVLKQSLLQLAVMGKLVPQDSNDEPASSFIKRIQAEKQRYLAESNSRRQKDLSTDLRTEPPFELPEGWMWQAIDDVLHVTGGVTLGRKLGGRKLLSKPYLRVANVQRGRLDLDQVKKVEIPEDEVEKYLLQSGDLLITEGGDWDKVGRTAIWRDELPECLHQNHVFRARAVLSDWEPRWAEMYLNSASAREYFAGSSKQTTNLASINMTQLRACSFPLPPLAEQHRIVAKVDQLMALCDQLKARLNEARQVQEHLADTLVEQAVA
ncbi:restriction endonuclease subunit S [Pseudomonas oryzihabitans]|uniref:restriction endonuclease subunit S n=1 Tax=Pseudomonas oryzihabitans TaxID=47885 RepID=UPI001476119A|nr:restriction endonuclease subunit S [Pseudomonas oryzihabitans]NMZ62866.1 restriction endonuclease subunit S [Pseudomonas oryzihabitans]